MPKLFQRAASSSPRPRRGHAGQSVVEFALVFPLIVILLFSIVDFARIFTTMLSVESAAREAADYGTFGSQKWSAPDVTQANMVRRACVASSALPDYVGPDDACTNPTFSCELSGDRGATWQPCSAGPSCDNPTREPPCWLKVTLEYDFKLLAPFRLEVSGNSYGVPNVITFQRSSTFPMTDLMLP